MKIGEVSKDTGLTVSNIRFYEKKGLLCPKRQEESRYREYGPEDVRRLKEIMLLRKLGIPVESIYLLYEGQAEYSSLLRHQERELEEQMEMLKGALELCRLLEEREPLEELNVDDWLVYVHQEEEKGRRFAEAEELLEDLAEFSKLSFFRGDPYVGRFFQRQWVVQALALLLALSIVFTAVSALISGIRSAFYTAVLFWLIYLVGLGLHFYWFRRRRLQERRRGNEDV